MKVPVIVIDRIGTIDRKLIRTELRRNLISAYEIEDRVIAVTGRIQAVRGFAMRAAIIGVPRCRYLDVDGEEINQAHDEPGQFTDYTKNKIHRFEGLDSATARRLWDALRAAKVECGIVENADGSHSVLAEHGGKEYAVVTEIVDAVLSQAGYQFVGAKRGQADGGIRGGNSGSSLGREGDDTAVSAGFAGTAAPDAPLERIGFSRN